MWAPRSPNRIQRLCFGDLGAPILATQVDVPMPYNAKLEQYVIPQASRIIEEGLRGSLPRLIRTD
ncbi:MAG: hypothetical protein U0359_14705 [Byssovorax sp.]